MVSLASAVATWLAIAIQPEAATRLALQPAARYITAAFRTHALVAFSGPDHGSPGTREFFAALIRHPGFAGTVTDIVVECGNARYQALADRYFAGDTVAPGALRQIWENTTVVSGVWQQPLYESILADIRAFNLTLPREQRIRVVLGDPPIDWTAVRGPADEDMNDWRDAHFAWAVEQHVMKKHRRALLWIGGAHTGPGLSRIPARPTAPRSRSIGPARSSSGWLRAASPVAPDTERLWVGPCTLARRHGGRARRESPRRARATLTVRGLQPSVVVHSMIARVSRPRPTVTGCPGVGRGLQTPPARTRPRLRG